MVKSDKINIKIEVCKDKNSGKLSIMAHFDSNAPNIIIDKEEYSWLPTLEEKDFLNDAFQLFPVDSSYTPAVERSPKVEEKKETKPIDHLPPLQRQKEPPVFEVTGEESKNQDYDKDVFEKRLDTRAKRYEPAREEPYTDEQEIKKKENERVIVEADSNAIDAAIKKHMDEDESFVEADEQTIIDKVLSQKKKGKWSKVK